MIEKRIEKKGYDELFNEVLLQIQQSRINAASGANRVIGEMNFNIGKIIIEKQNKYGWGKSIVEKLSDDLNDKFDGRDGFSPQNLWFMRQFFLEYNDNPKLRDFAFTIPWGRANAFKTKRILK